MNTTMIAAFKSREQTISLYRTAKQNGIPCNIVNTPREVGVCCGISVSFDPEHMPYIQRLIYKGNYDRFIGFFKVVKTGYGTAIEKIG